VLRLPIFVVVASAFGVLRKIFLILRRSVLSQANLPFRTAEMANDPSKGGTNHAINFAM
jgi:hypothetical protein